MSQLHELQKRFVAALNSNDDAIFTLIQPTAYLSAQEHLAIYQSSITGALQKALKEIYPVCRKLVGEDFFIGMINPYIEHYSSQAPDLASYGEHLADFIATFPPAMSLPYLADVARLEWAWHSLFTARASRGVAFDQLAAQSETQGERIIFLMPPKSSLLTSPYPIHRIWEVNQDDYTNEQAIVLPDNARFYYLVWRKELGMRIDLLERETWQILTWMQAKVPWGEICEKVSQTLPQVDLESWLPQSVSTGWIAEFEI